MLIHGMIFISVRFTVVKRIQPAIEKYYLSMGLAAATLTQAVFTGNECALFSDL